MWVSETKYNKNFLGDLNMKRFTASFTLATLLASSMFSADSFADQKKPEFINTAGFEDLLFQVSNWGRWGDQDQLGTLNLITAEKRISASKLVKTGAVVSLALPMNEEKDEVNQSPFIHEPFIFPAAFGIPPEQHPEAAGDNFSVAYHGFAHSHLDAISHFAYKGKMYNGFPFKLEAGGFAKLGIENIAESGIITRGVLVDFPAFFGVDFLQPGRAITTEDLLAWEKKSGVKIGSGDALLIKTGRWKAVEELGQWTFTEKAAGLHTTVATFLKERDVAVIGCDGVSDVMPSGVENRFNPLHELTLIGMGMPIFDNLDLRKLSDVARQLKRSTFMLVAAPLNVEGATGSPLNPMAIF